MGAALATRGPGDDGGSAPASARGDAARVGLLGIIPFTAQRTVWPLEAFYLYDDHRGVVETLTAEVNVTQPRELADYGKAFGELSKMAVYGAPARALIASAIDTLR